MSRKSTLLTACSAIASDTLGADGWVKIMPMGVSKPKNGQPKSFFIEDVAHAQRVATASVAYWGEADMAVDYDHQMVRATGKSPAAGWIKAVEARADGIWGKLELTGTASAEVADKQYRYLSPAFQHQPDGRVVRIINVALTNTPNLDLTALASAITASQEEDDDMNLTAIATALGLKADASETDVLAAIGKTKAAADALTATASALGVTVGDDLTAVASAATALKTAKAAEVDPAKFVPVETLTALQAEMSAVTKRVDAADAKERVAMMDAAQADGRLTPATRTYAESLTETTALASFLATLAPTNLGTKVTGGKKPVDEAGLDATDLALCSTMGIEPKDYLATMNGGAK